MVLRHIQAGKVVVVVLNLGALVNLKAHTGEHVDDLILDEGYRVQAAGLANLGGHCDVDGLSGVAGLERGLFDLLGQGLILCLGPLLELIDSLADGGTVLLGDIAQTLGQARDLAVLAQVFLPEVRKPGFVGDFCAGLLNGGAQLLDFFFHSTPLLEVGPEQTKRLRPCVESGTKPCKIQFSAVPPVFRTVKRGTLCCR